MATKEEKQKVIQAIKNGEIIDDDTLKVFLLKERLKGKKGEIGEKGDKSTKKELLELIKPLIPKKPKDGMKGKDGKTPVIDTDKIALDASKMAFKALLPKIPTLSQIEKDLPILGNSIRDSLELLQDEERIDISAIKGMEFFQKKTDHLLLGGYGGMNLYVSGSKIGAVKTVNFTGVDVSHSKVNGMDTVTFAHDSEDFWDRAGTVITPHTAGDDITTTGTVLGSNIISGDGIKKITVGVTQPTSPQIGDIWLDTN